jgi:hypothetical protein
MFSSYTFKKQKDQVTLHNYFITCFIRLWNVLAYPYARTALQSESMTDERNNWKMKDIM